MEIHYCADCSSRIQEGEVQFVEGIAYCVACHRKKFPAPSRTGLKPAARRSTPAKAVARPSTDHQTKPVAGALPRSEAHRTSTARVSKPAGRNTGTFLVVGGICAALIFVPALFLFLSPPEKTAPAARPDERAGRAVAASVTPPSKNPDLPAPAPTAKQEPATAKPTDAMAEVREGIARRRYDELLANERDGKLDGGKLHKALRDFILDYGSTAVGGEASTKLQALPAPPEPEPRPEPPGATKAAPPAPSAPADALVHFTFETDDDFRSVKKGERTAKGGFDRPGSSVVSQKEESPFFTSRIQLQIKDGQGVPVQPDTWVRFAVFLEQGDPRICLHTGIGEDVYERHVEKLPRGQWTWVCFRMREYTKSFKSKDPVPKPNSHFRGTAIFGCGLGGKPTRFYIDDFTLGNGPLPEP